MTMSKRRQEEEMEETKEEERMAAQSRTGREPRDTRRITWPGPILRGPWTMDHGTSPMQRTSHVHGPPIAAN